MTDAAMFAWCPESVPSGVPVVQVYGWLLDTHGRVLLQDTDRGAFNLPGGTPEPEDHGDMVATLRREAWEESQVTLPEVGYLGYERVLRDGYPRAMARCVARIDTFHTWGADPDRDRWHRRVMAPLLEAVELLGWVTREPRRRGQRPTGLSNIGLYQHAYPPRRGPVWINRTTVQPYRVVDWRRGRIEPQACHVLPCSYPRQP